MMTVNNLFGREVRPLPTVAAYVGGKRQLAKLLVPAIEGYVHDLYAEAFVGLGGVFFRRRIVPRVEVINDRSEDVATLFRVLQHHYVAFMDYMRYQLTSRAEFERLSLQAPGSLTDIQRSARFLYLQRLAFGGKVEGRNFGVDGSAPAGFNINRLAVLLDEVHSRLSAVTIERLDFEAFLSRYDRPSALFFLDPPYIGTEGYYGADLFSAEDTVRLALAMSRLQGACLMTNVDCPQSREIFAGFSLWSAPVNYTVAAGDNAAKRREIIVANRDFSLQAHGAERLV